MTIICVDCGHEIISKDVEVHIGDTLVCNVCGAVQSIVDNTGKTEAISEEK